MGRETGKSCNASQGLCRDASGLTGAGTYSWGEGKKREVGREEGKQGGGKGNREVL